MLLRGVGLAQIGDEPASSGPIPKVKNGCSAHSDCFSCPYPDCIAYSKNSNQASQTAMRIERLRTRAAELRSGGMPCRQIAVTLGISRRSVFRLLKMGKT